MLEFGILEGLIVFVGIILALHSYIARGYDHWEKRGVSGPKPTVPFGNGGDILLRRKPLAHKLREFYNSYENERFFGYFMGGTPIFVVKDPDLIKQVLIKDFNVFNDRGVKINEDTDPLATHLFNISGQRWKVLRNRLSPVFTTGKIKHMFNLMNNCADHFESYFKERVAENDIIECYEHAARYSTDVIGSCVFGINTQALNDENSVFRKMGRQLFRSPFSLRMKRILRQVVPRIYGFFRLGTVPTEVTNFFIKTIKETIELREKEKIVRNDFIDVLMNIPKDNEADGFVWTDHLLTAQAFVFFAAGFETSSSTISFALWELARTPDVQEKLRREILEFHKNNHGKITYETINEMKYLDMVVKETLRKNPPVVVLVRKVSHDYVVPGTNITLPAGQIVQIPAYNLQHDPKYFPKPEVFDPERFTDEAKNSRHPMVFLPFGDGPKNCIGARFGYYQVKLGLLKIIKNFRVHPTTRTDEPYVIDMSSVVLASLGGIVLKFERLDSSI